MPSNAVPSSPPVSSSSPLLLHCCCGPCATACVERLVKEGRPCRLFFSNSNIATRDEFELRLEQLRKVARHFDVGEVIVDDYRHDRWLEHLSALPGYANCHERGPRCRLCFDFSLGRAASAASDLGMPFATSLTVSPHKSSALLFQVGSPFDNYEHWDFKKKDGFLRSLQLSRQLELYRQSFCGCEFSRRDSEQKEAGNSSEPQRIPAACPPKL